MQGLQPGRGRDRAGGMRGGSLLFSASGRPGSLLQMFAVFIAAEARDPAPSLISFFPALWPGSQLKAAAGRRAGGQGRGRPPHRPASDPAPTRLPPRLPKYEHTKEKHQQIFYFRE